MRYYTTITAFVLIFAASELFSGSDAAAESAEFGAWARVQSERFDARWNSIARTAPTNVEASFSRFRSMRPSKVRTGISKRSNLWTGSKSGFIHKGGRMPFMELSSRPRRGPSRGVTGLRNPAKARLNVPHSGIRNPRAGIPDKHFFSNVRSSTRPNLRIGSRTGGRSRSGFTRPAYRVNRPRGIRR